MTIWHEVRTTNKRMSYPVNLVPASEVHNHTGFVSQYGYDDTVANKIRQQRGTFDLDGLPLYSDVLYIDFDDNDAAAMTAKELLKQYSYKMYDTGGRGFHYHVDIQPMYTPDTPQRQKQWLKDNIPGCDYNIMKSSAVIRLPGTWHAKHPGRCKQLVATNKGSKLVIPELASPPRLKFTPQLALDVEKQEEILDFLLFKTIRVGTVGRNNHAYKIACACRGIGKDYYDTLTLIEAWSRNNSQPPLKSAEIEATVKSAYRQRRQA